MLQPKLFGHGSLRGLRCHFDVALGPVDHRVRPGRLSLRRIQTPHASGHDGPGSSTFGVVLGCAAATKFTGWFLPLPFLVWSCLYRSRPGFKTLLVGGLIAIAVLFALMPPVVARSGHRRHSVPGIEPDPRHHAAHPGRVSRHRLQHAQRLAAVVQHARLDRVCHAGRLLDLGGRRIRASPEDVAKRADRALDRRALGFS